jgi:pre-60S factor REI1
VAGVPGVTEALFMARQSALAEESNSTTAAAPMSYSCTLCGKGYRSSKAHAEHLKTRSHLMRASQDPNASTAAVVKPLPERAPRRGPSAMEEDEDEDEDDDEDEWVEMDPSELESTSNMQVEEDSKSDDDMDDLEVLDPSFCFMCDLKHDNIEDCMIHMHKKHGFFIPDSEYLKDPSGLLTYVGLKVGIFSSVLVSYVR